MKQRHQKTSNAKKDLEFLFEIGTLRNVERVWRQMTGVRMATILEHSARVALLSLIIARMEGVVDEGKILKMALAHDLSESRVGDHNYVHAVYTSTDEKRAVDDMFAETILSDFSKNLLVEFEEQETPESKIVKDADKLDCDLEIKELKEKGHQLPSKWRRFRKIVRNQELYTVSARKLWDAIRTADASSWHISANKWTKHLGKK